MNAAATRTLLALLLFSPLARSEPLLHVSGGITLNGVAQPLLFTWNSSVPVTGAGWAPNETVQIILHGPLDSPGVHARSAGASARLAPAGVAEAASARLGRTVFGRIPRPVVDLAVGVFTADSRGNLAAAPVIPFDSGIVGPQARIPRPGFYEVRAVGRVSGTTAAGDRINLCPDTAAGHPVFTWGTDRGGREGVLPDVLRQFSPERFDPEWPTTWDEQAVELYGVVAPVEADAPDQPSRISPSDNPPTHYAHDATIFVTPDAGYRWLVGTANYLDGDPDGPGRGTIEVEWETQNGGSTAAYGQGNIGLPLWTMPTVGDRVYVVGRWILDAGHPESGDRTEIHPARLVATLRERPAVSFGASAAQVDVYVSGHGGGANWMPPGLSEVLDQGRHGGGRIRDVLSPADQDRYYRAGPVAPLLYPLLVQVIRQLTGISISATIYGESGPSAFPWGGPGAEERPINDEDYTFDVPLPAAPSGPALVNLEVVTHPEHTTAVDEQVTYSGPSNGAPTVAHIRLPYRGADSRIYARTFKFSWRQDTAPANRWVVRLTRIDVTDLAGKWQMWGDVSGQWSYLSGIAPALLDTAAGRSVTLPVAPMDVYLGAGQTLRVYVHGYRAACLDDFFGKLFGQSSYVAGISFVGQCGPTDNVDLGNAVLELPASPSPRGSYMLAGKDASGNHHFAVAVTVDSP
jgi:hypothetical protein